MITRYTTRTGSIYEIDDMKMRARRLNDRQGTSERVGFDGVWKPIVKCRVTYQGCLEITWPDTVPHAKGTVPGTLTSPVVKAEKIGDQET